MIFKCYNLKCRLLNFFLKENTLYFRQLSSKKSYKVLFFGSEGIALSSFKKVNELKKEEKVIDRLDLVTASNTYNKSSIQKYAQVENINILKWPLQNLKPGEYDIGLIVAFGHLIKENILNKFPLGMVNVHPSLLPRWRGAAPIIYTLLNGDKVSGVTLMKIKANVFDVGEIISQEKVSISKDIKLPELTQQLSDIGAEMLVECLRNLPHSLENSQPQSKDGVTYAKKINKSISEVNWSEAGARDIYNLYRAIYGVFSLKTKFRDKEMKLFNAFLHNIDELDQTNKPIGTIEFCEKTKAIRILCRDRKYIYFKSLRIVGKKEITALDFYNGYIKNVKLNKVEFKVSKVKVTE